MQGETIVCCMHVFVPSSSGPPWCVPSPPAGKLCVHLIIRKMIESGIMDEDSYPGRWVRVWPAGLLDMTRHPGLNLEEWSFRSWSIDNSRISFFLLNPSFAYWRKTSQECETALTSQYQTFFFIFVFLSFRILFLLFLFSFFVFLSRHYADQMSEGSQV